MGKAFVIRNVDWSLVNLGQVTEVTGLIIVGSRNISGASIYTALYEESLVSATWSVSGNATLDTQSGSIVELTPTEAGTTILTASYTTGGVTYTATLSIQINIPHLEILPSAEVISAVTTFSAYYDNEVDTNAVFSISNSSLASLVDNGDGTCTVTPIAEDNSTSVTLTATSTNGTATMTFVPSISVLPSGYTRMLYVQGHSSPYINTGFAPSSDTRVVLDFQFIHASSNDSYAYVIDDNNLHNLTINSGSTTAIYTGLTTSLTFKDWKRHQIDINQSRIIFDGTTYTNTTENPESWTSSANLWLFGGRASGVIRASASRIYRCQIYDGSTMVRDYVPCQRVSDDIFGLYDIVNGVFYAPANADVLYGQRTEPDYVSSGLIAKFDGYDASTAYWADTYDGLFGVALPEGTTKTSDGMGVVLTDASTTAKNPADYTNANATIDSGTVEVVYKIDTAPSAAMGIFKGYTAKSGTKGKFAFWIDGSGNVRNDFYTAKEINNSISNYIGRTITQSVNATLNYVNGISLGKGATAESTGAPGGTSTPAIGGFKVGGTSYYQFTGTIYQIRFYNRELTAEEIQHNQTIDMARYNINN